MPSITRRPKRTAVLPTPPNEADLHYIYRSIEQPPHKAVKQEHHSPERFDVTSKNLKASIEDAIETDADSLFAFLDAFNTATNSMSDPDEDVTTAPVAKAISSFLSTRGIKSMHTGPSKAHPSLISVFDEGEGPCLVMNGLLGPSSPSATIPETAGTAAIVASYAYLYSLRNNLTGTVVLQAISDNEDGASGACRFLLHEDERKRLWRGDCMLTSLPTSLPCASEPTPDSTNAQGILGLSAACATHPVATALSNNGKRVMGTRPTMPGFPTESHARFWSEVGVPSFSFGIQDGKGLENKTPNHERKELKETVEMELQDMGSDERAKSVEEIKESRKAQRKQWLQLVKVLALTGWDCVGLNE